MAFDREETTTACNFFPNKISAYADPSYWDERFIAEDHYEWLKDYSHFQHLIRPHICTRHSILELGCGNSRLSEGLHAEGEIEVTCIDLSSVAVQRMKQRLKEKGLRGIHVIEADMLELPFESESFDVVVEKGTMDVLYVDSGDPWNPRPDTVNKVMKLLKGVHRILKPDGIFISISFGQPHFRRKLFEDPCFTWSVEWKTFGDGFHYFFYTLKKDCSVFKTHICVVCTQLDLPHVVLTWSIAWNLIIMNEKLENKGKFSLVMDVAHVAGDTFA